MSPASYRAAPPRVGDSTVTRPGPSGQIESPGSQLPQQHEPLLRWSLTALQGLGPAQGLLEGLLVLAERRPVGRRLGQVLGGTFLSGRGISDGLLELIARGGGRGGRGAGGRDRGGGPRLPGQSAGRVR